MNHGRYNGFIASTLIDALRSCNTPDTQRLKVLDHAFRERVEWAHADTQQRVAFLWQIDCWAEDGEIAVVTSGMDCDCSRWEDDVRLVPATVSAVDKWLDDFYAGAEGPQGHRLMRPSEAKLLRRTSRDLALEAFEDGHAHSVHY